MELREVSPLGHDPDIKGFNFTFSHTSLNKKNNSHDCYFVMFHRKSEESDE